MQEIKLKAYAKINIGLDVLKRRSDGYHEVCMIMQTISLHDVIQLKKIEENIIKVVTDSRELPTDHNNLVYKAAKLLFDEYKLEGGIQISLEKNIPIAAGLAGGSTDAAAVLRGINHLYQLNLTRQALMNRGVRLGADIPYCIIGETALAEGIGEKLTLLPKLPDCHILIAKPDIAVSTKWVYENLHANSLTHHPDITSMVEAIKANDLQILTSKMENVLETVTERKYPLISDIKQMMMQEYALCAMMSGSGPTVFGIFSSEKEVEKAYNKLKKNTFIKDIAKATPIHDITK